MYSLLAARILMSSDPVIGDPDLLLRPASARFVSRWVRAVSSGHTPPKALIDDLKQFKDLQWPRTKEGRFGEFIYRETEAVVPAKDRIANLKRFVHGLDSHEMVRQDFEAAGLAVLAGYFRDPWLGQALFDERADGQRATILGTYQCLLFTNHRIIYWRSVLIAIANSKRPKVAASVFSDQLLSSASDVEKTMLDVRRSVPTPFLDAHSNFQPAFDLFMKGLSVSPALSRQKKNEETQTEHS